MAFADLGSLGATGATTNNQATLVLTTTLTASVGNLVVLVIGDDNTGTVNNADGNEVSSVQNSGTANNWVKAKGWVRTAGVAQDGAAVQIWYTVVTTQITSGATITITFANAANSDATAVTGRVFSKATGSVSIIASNGLSTAAADPAALNATHGQSLAALRIRGISGQIGTSTVLTPTASWTAWAAGNSAVTGTTTEICVRAEHIISTATGASSDPTWVACDNANAYVVFAEGSPGAVGWESQGAQYVTQAPPPGGSNKSRAGAGALAGPLNPVEIAIIAPPLIRGFDSQDDFFPLSQTKARRAGALKQKIGFSVPSPWYNYGWEVQPPQPPRPGPWRYCKSALAQNIYFYSFSSLPFIEVQPPQPPKPKPWRFASMLFKGQDAFPTPGPPVLLTADYAWMESPGVYPKKNFAKQGAALKFKIGFSSPSTWYNYGWDVQSVQPPHPKRERFGALVSKDDGTQSPFIFVTAEVTSWFETQWTFPRKHYAKWAALAPKADGIERPFEFWRNAGWEVQSVQPPRQQWRKWPLADWDDGNYSQYFVWRNGGWEVQPPQPPHPRREKFGAIIKGDEGSYDLYFPTAVLQTGSYPWYESPWVHQKRPRYDRSALTTINQFFAYSLFPFTFQVQHPQPPHPRPEKAGTLFGKEDGIEFPFVPPVIVNWWEAFPALTAKVKRNLAALRTRSEIGYFAQWTNDGWQVQPPQPPHPRREKSGAILEGDDGIQGVKPFGLQTGQYPWLETPWVYPQKYMQRNLSALRTRSEIGYFAQWVNGGWEVQSPQPPHPRREKFGSLVKGDDGNQFIFFPTAVLLTGDFRWFETPWVYPKKNFAKWAAIAEGDDGNQFPFTPTLQTNAYPWYESPWIYPRRKPERWGAIAEGDDGTAGRFEFFRNFGWPIQPWQPPHRAPERKAAAWFEGDDGTQSRYIRWINAGWEIQPWQPPAIRYERAGAIIVPVFIDSILGEVFVPPPLIPPRRRSKRLISLFFQSQRPGGPDDQRSNVQNPNIRRVEDFDPSR